MALEQKKKSIGNTTYLVTQMDGIRALKAQTKLIKIIGPSIFTMVGKDLKKLTAEDIVRSIIPVLSTFDDEVVNEFVLSLFETGVFKEINGTPKKVDFAVDFAGNFMDMWKVVAFILEANFMSGESIESILHTTEKVKQTPEI